MYIYIYTDLDCDSYGLSHTGGLHTYFSRSRLQTQKSIGRLGTPPNARPGRLYWKVNLLTWLATSSTGNLVNKSFHRGINLFHRSWERLSPSRSLPFAPFRPGTHRWKPLTRPKRRKWLWLGSSRRLLDRSQEWSAAGDCRSTTKNSQKDLKQGTNNNTLRK